MTTQIERTRRIVWTDPLSKQRLTYATFPKGARAEVKHEILDRIREGVRNAHGDEAAASVALSD